MVAEESVCLREFNEHTSRYVHRVRETGRPIDITYHGRPVARLVPSTREEQDLTVDEWWAEMEEFGNRLSSRWPKDVSAVEAIGEDRR